MGARRTINRYRETPSGYKHDDVLVEDFKDFEERVLLVFVKNIDEQAINECAELIAKAWANRKPIN